MLDQDSDEAFETPKRRAMNHHWSMPLIIGSHILELEAFRQIVIELHRPQLPFAAKAILHHEIKLRAVERSFALHCFMRQTHFFGDTLQRLFRLFPMFRIAGVFVALRIAQAHLHTIIRQPEHAENMLHQFNRRPHLLLDLLRRAE